MSGSKFISMLQEGGLYFNRADRFEDPFEGVFPKARLEEEYTRTKASRKIRELTSELAIFTSNKVERHESSLDELLDTIDWWRRRIYLNCWHMNEFESMAMWKAYIPNGDGIAIKSTFAMLDNSLDEKDEWTYRIGTVRYYDYEDKNFEQLLTDKERLNWLYPFVHKREEYAHEKEVRVAIGYESRDNFEEGATGFVVPTNLNGLVESIVISPHSPPWSNKKFWEDICRKYDLQIDVKESELVEKPADILSGMDHKRIEKNASKIVDDWKTDLNQST